MVVEDGKGPSGPPKEDLAKESAIITENLKSQSQVML